MLFEPPPTQADLHFRLAGFPVRVHPFFWVVALILGVNSVAGEPKATLMWVAVVFVSIVVHELGHALVQRKFGGHPRIVLHGFGGLAICNDCDRNPRSQMLILFAGPAAGFLFAGVLMLVAFATAAEATFVPFWQEGAASRGLVGVNLLIGEFRFQPYPSFMATLLLWMLLQINVVWGLINLLPIYPLDGGQIAREALTLGHNPREGLILSLKLSIGFAAAMAAWGLFGRQSLYVAILFGYLGYMSFRALEAYTDRRPGAGWR